MTVTARGLDIQPAISENERIEGYAFVNEQYLRAFNVLPSPTDHLLVARRGSSIVGTIGINTWNEGTGLRLSKLYEFDRSSLTIPIDLPSSVEFARWASDEKGVACALLHAASSFSLRLGAKYVWCEHSPAVNRICRSYGIHFHKVSEAHRNTDLVEKHHQAFYDSTDARLFVFSLAQAEPALTTYLKTHPF